MRLHGPLGLLSLLISSAAASGTLWARAPPRGSSSDGDGGADSDGTPVAKGNSPNGGSSAASKSRRGDSACGRSVCIAAEVNGDVVRYTLTSQRDSVGWMAMGFGTRMVQSPMVIMWANSDGSLTLSQRLAVREEEPSVVSNPPRVATAQSEVSVTSGTKHQYVFEIPANDDTRQNVIWAYSDVRPSSAEPDAQLTEHVDQGRLTLDLTKTTILDGGNEEGADASDSSSGAAGGPLTSGEKVLLAHAIVATIGFLLVLPIGALIPRYLRTFTTGWLKFHWTVQFLLGGLTVIIGVVLGIVGVSKTDGSHMSGTHHRAGVTLLVLWAVQAALGTIIHKFKPKDVAKRRPPQNYVHAVLGLLIIGVAFWQVRTGYRDAWPSATGREAPRGVNILWIVWVALLPTAYAAGLAFLPKQFRQERKMQQGTSSPSEQEKITQDPLLRTRQTD